MSVPDEDRMLDFAPTTSILLHLMKDLVQDFRDQLGQKEYDRIESCWLDLLEARTPLDKLLELVELTERYAPHGKAAILLSVLADTLKERKSPQERLLVLRRLVRLSPDEPKLAREIADCLREIHREAPELERLLQKSGLGYGRPLRTALLRLDGYLALLPGTWVFDPENGPGKIEKLDLLLDCVVVMAVNGHQRTLEIDRARTLLRTTDPEGFFRRMESSKPALVRLAAESPGELVRLYLKDIGQRAGIEEIQTGLAELVAPDNWDDFWNRARRELDRNPHVVMHTRPARTFQWSDEPFRKKASKGKAASKPAPAGTPDVDKLAGMSEKEIAGVYAGLSGFAGRKRLLENLEQARPGEWAGIAVRLFRISGDRRARALIEKMLSPTRPELWKEAMSQALTGYRQGPEAFLWLVENSDRLKLEVPHSAFLSRIVDLLESTPHRKHWPGLRKALTGDNCHLVGAAFEMMKEQDVRRVISRLGRIRGIEPYQLGRISEMAAARFPGLGDAGAKEAILSSAAGIEKARKQLRKLISDDLPAVAEEIARARAHGDLSENYEFKAAKEKRARLLASVNRLKVDLNRAEPIDPSRVDSSRVSVGCRVRLEDESGRTADYVLLGPWDSDPDQHVISYLAPFGQQLLGKKPNETVEFDGQVQTLTRISPALPD